MKFGRSGSTVGWLVGLLVDFRPMLVLCALSELVCAFGVYSCDDCEE